MKKSKLLYFYIFFIYNNVFCQNNNKPLSSRLQKYQNYLKKDYSKPKPRLIKVTKAKNTRNYIDPLCEHYLFVLHANYKTSVKLFKQYLEFLKNKNSHPLNAFKVRTHQLKNFLQRVLDSAIIIKSSINRSQSTIKKHIDEHKTIALELIDTQSYSRLHYELQSLKFYQNSYLSFLSEINQREILHLEDILYKVNSWLNLALLTEQNNWKKSSHHLLLKDNKKLINKIHKEVPLIAKKFKNIKDHFTYAEQEIIVDKTKLKKKSFPFSKKMTSIQLNKLKRRQKSFRYQLSILNEKETIELKMIQKQILSSQRLSPIELRLNPLSHHLFFNHSIKKKEVLPDWI
ncbi:MAG: hypothetical protein COB02_12470 [Candidatus Cloacimonadota bacterium]|nr:MAG: hypothetical protein COB02_12470 [Candidatus Cloacimonadota bacterium]